jgi:hypothetical protein
VKEDWMHSGQDKTAELAGVAELAGLDVSAPKQGANLKVSQLFNRRDYWE